MRIPKEWLDDYLRTQPAPTGPTAPVQTAPGPHRGPVYLNPADLSTYGGDPNAQIYTQPHPHPQDPNAPAPFYPGVGMIPPEELAHLPPDVLAMLQAQGMLPPVGADVFADPDPYAQYGHAIATHAPPATATLEQDLQQLREQAYQEAYDTAFQQALTEGRTQGYDEGYHTGLQDAQSMLDGQLQELKSAIETILGAKETALLGVQDEILPVAYMLTEKMIKTQSACDPELVLSLLKDVLRQIERQQKQVVIYTHPQDVNIVEGWLQENPAPFRIEATFIVEEREDVDKGSCIVETKSGQIDARFSVQLATLRSLLGLEGNATLQSATPKEEAA